MADKKEVVNPTSFRLLTKVSTVYFLYDRIKRQKDSYFTQKHMVLFAFYNAQNGIIKVGKIGVITYGNDKKKWKK
ncbi:hypothetical protein Aargi30884_12860 [Amedibacterium intestinale]|uniref:Uncharacterized protein n=1 Tax=Amedibacterium intestinale TaxID=2583452 RepID=A0A6N4THX8_9FIRM|nr:hypothetical protein Aargi30884_12860 [Amedibacterium intestinale]